MVMRNSGPLNTGAPQAGQVLQGTGGGTVAPDVRKFQQGGVLKGQSTTDRVLNSLIPLGTNLANTAFKEDLETKYLEGVQAAAQGKSEEDLETNPVTADWTKAGYRDTAGRLAVAQQQAQLQLDLPKLVQGTPEQFKAYLAEKRKPLMDQMQGMSKQQRAAMFGQLANDEVANQTKYTSGRAKWILEQEQASIQQSMTVRRMNLDAAKDNPAVYDQEVKGFVGSMYKDIWQNPKLTEAMKKDLTRQGMEFASSSDNVAVYDAIRSTNVDFPDGKKGTMMSRLDFEDQIKVDTAHRSAMDRVKVVRSADFETQIASWETEWSDPEGSATQTYEEVDAALKTAQGAGILATGKRESVLQNYFKAVARNAKNGVAAKAWGAGDSQTLADKGVSQQDGLNAWLKAQRGQPLEQTVGQLLTIGKNTGQDIAIKEAGNKLKPAFATLGYQDDIDPTNAKMVMNTLNALAITEQTNPGARSKFMEALEPAQQDMVLYMGELQKEGVADPLTVTKMARAKVMQDAAGGALRQEQVSKALKDDVEALGDVGDRQILGALSQTAKSWFSADAATRKRIGTYRSWFEDESRTADVRAQGLVELRSEMNDLAKANPTMTSSSRMSKALARIGARTVDTASGPLIMPKGQTVQSFFGVPQYADQAYVGKAIDTFMEPEEGQRVAWGLEPGNKLTFRVYNEKGGIVRSGIMNPKDIAPVVEEQLNKEAEEAANHSGPGVEEQGVRFNGLNTAGQSAGGMLALRRDLIKSEGVKNTAYEDAGGKSFGVGIHQTNNHYQRPINKDGTYTDGQVRESFLRASNDAANLAAKSMSSIGVKGDDYLRFFGELAYQSPGSARDPDLLAHISLGNKQEAVTALMQTAAYKNSPDDRRERYLSKLKAAMR